MFFDDVNIDLASYADDTTPYAYDLESEKIYKLLGKNVYKHLDDSLKANFDKCHLLINTDENLTLKLKMKLLLKVLIKNCLVYYSIINLISMNMSLHYSGKPLRS